MGEPFVETQVAWWMTRGLGLGEVE